ncbi:uncharacterized protein LOC144622229 [Crassostrea virginica]
MASNCNVTTQGQEAVVCDLCQSPVSFFCRRCGVNLCDPCVLLHLRVKSQFGHDVVEYASKDDDECSVFCKTICERKTHELSELSVKIEEVLKYLAQENDQLQSFRHELEAPLDPAQIRKCRKVLEAPSVSSVIDTGFPASEKYNNRLYDMAVTDDQKVWMGGYSRELKLFDLQGHLLRTVPIATIVMYICYQSKVVRYSSAGTVLQEIQYDSQYQSLYQDAWYIAENVNGDIIVTDFQKRKVIAVDILGLSRYTYSGRNNDLDACSVATDSVGHVFVTDYTGDKIHMLDRNGRFLRYITPQGGIKGPRAVCMISDGEMIVGEQNTGLAKRIKLLE